MVQGLLAIGTLSMGVVLFDPAAGRLSSLDRLCPGLEARNITLLLADEPGRLWIGTYGEGLYLWEPGPQPPRALQPGNRRSAGRLGALRRRSPRSGTCFGTFGGGLAFLDGARGAWKRFGLADGLPALDISALARRSPYALRWAPWGRGWR